MPAPKNPWIARHRIICSMLEANPHTKLAMVKPEAEIANNSLVPKARDRNPESGIAITSAIKYEVWTHDTSVALAERPAWISVSEAETTWMSRIDMNIPNTMMRNANSRRGAMRSEAAAAAAFIIAGEAVVASAMICSGRDSSTGHAPDAKLLRLDHGRRVEIRVAVGVGCAFMGIDGGIDRHARAQQVPPRDFPRHTNANRKPLHDLGEIAGGVVRRQQREYGARGRRDAVDNAGELAMAVSVDRDRHRLAWTDAPELGFLEVGVDEDFIERHYIAEPLPDHDVIAGGDQPVGEDAVDRGAHRGEIEIALGPGERSLQFRKLGGGLGLLRFGDLDIVARRVIGGLRGLHRRDALVASGLGLLEGGVGGKTLVAQRLLPVVIEVGPLQSGIRRCEVRARLFDRAYLGGDLPADAIDGGFLRGDPGPRGIHRDPIIAVVDPEHHVAGAHQSVVAGKDRRDMSGYPGAQRGVVGAHIGVIGGNVEPADQEILGSIAGRGERQQSDDAR